MTDYASSESVENRVINLGLITKQESTEIILYRDILCRNLDLKDSNSTTAVESLKKSVILMLNDRKNDMNNDMNNDHHDVDPLSLYRVDLTYNDLDNDQILIITNYDIIEALKRPSTQNDNDCMVKILAKVSWRFLKYMCTPEDNELILAIEGKDDTRVAELLPKKDIQRKINFNYIDVNTKVTPLILAVRSNKPVHFIVSALLNYGADPNIIPSPTEWTALHYACQHQQFRIIEILLKHKANVNCEDVNGWTPLDTLLSYINYKSTVNERYIKFNGIMEQEYVRCVRLLLDNHAKFNIHGIAYLFNAIEYYEGGQKNLEMLRLLLNSKSLDVNFQLVRPYSLYMKGDTILHCAIRITNIAIVQMIMECCTAPNLLIRNSDNETPYDIALRYHHKPIMKCLKWTLVLQSHEFLRQKWSLMKQKPTIANKDDNATIILSSSKRQKR